MSFDFTVTDRAMNKVKDLLAAEKDQDQLLYISVKNAGCAGLSYSLDFLKEAGNNISVEKGGLTILVDPSSADYLNGMTIDCNLTGTFSFENPNAKGGCGIFFSV
ncbi:MAG: iron-sulfur cluster assembly accessory protein [Bacteroidetes bacterium]|nr:iron-sulfur cluster assembly accessory protein [Bacteroidota bacterium]